MAQQSTPVRNEIASWLPIAILAITIGILFFTLIQGETLFWGLPSLQFVPWRQFAMQEIAAGRGVLWNPYVGGGAPLLANYQSALLYPPHVLYLIAPTPHIMGWLGMLHLLWAGIGIWLFTRRLNLPTFARGVAALAYPLCTTLVARFGTPPMVDVAAWLPWLMWGIDRLVSRPRLASVVILALISAAQLLAGHAQWTFYSLLLAGGYAVWRVWSERQPVSRLVIAVLAITLGAALAAAQLLPTAELQRLSQRAERVDQQFALNFSFAPVSLLTLVNPDMFGNPGDGSYAVGGAYFETTAYIGFLPILLAVIAMRWQRRTDNETRHLRLFFVITALVTLVLATGSYTPLYPLLYRFVPTFNLFQAPARWLLLTVFSLSILAATAAARWEPTFRGKRAARLLLAMAAALVVVGLIGSAVATTQADLLQRLAAGLGRIGVTLAIVAGLILTQPKAGARRRGLWQVAALLFIAADLGWANRLSNPTVSPAFYDTCPREEQANGRFYWPTDDERRVFDRFLNFMDYTYATRHQQEFRCSRLPNLGMLDAQPSFNNFDPLRPAWYEAYVSALNETPTPELLRAAAIQTVAGLNSDEGDAPRLWLAAQVIAATDYRDAIQKIAPERTTAVVEGFAGTLSGAALSAPDQIRVLSSEPTAWRIQVTTSADRWLVVADTYYLGWKATLNGMDTPIYRTNGAFRGIHLPQPGQYTVEMRYDPDSFRLGVVVSALTAAILVVLSLVAVARKSQQVNVNR